MIANACGSWMNLKTIGIVVGTIGVAGAVFVIGGGQLMPRHLVVTRTVQISASTATIHAIAGDLSRWHDWTQWSVASDPSLKETFEGKSNEVGGKMTWTGDLLGTGFVRITKTSPDTGVEYDLSLQDARFVGTGAVRYAPAGAATTVTWTEDTDLGANPLSHWFGPMIRNAVGADFDSGLATLKSTAEADEMNLLRQQEGYAPTPDDARDRRVVIPPSP
jgi:hypothetical protein